MDADLPIRVVDGCLISPSGRGLLKSNALVANFEEANTNTAYPAVWNPSNQQLTMGGESDGQIK